MWEKIRKSKPLLVLFLTGVVWIFLRFLTPLICPVLLALLFVTIFGPLLQKLQTHFHINRQVGAILLLLIATFLVSVLIWVLSSWMIGSLPRWFGTIGGAEGQVRIVVRSCADRMGRLAGLDGEYLEQTIMNCVGENLRSLGDKTIPRVLSVSWESVKVMGWIGGFMITFFLSTILLAKDYDRMMNVLLERQECHVILSVICAVIRYIATYVKAQIVIVGIISGFAAVVLALLRIPNGMLWGLLAGILDALPFVGTSVVLIPMAIWQVINGNYVRAGICILLYVVCIFLRELLEPKLIGKRMGFSTLAVLVSLYVGIQLFGIWGIIKGPLGFVLIVESYRSLQQSESLSNWPDEPGRSNESGSPTG